MGCQGVSRGVGASGARRGCRGFRGLEWHVGVPEAMGRQVDWKPNHIGPQSRVPALPLAEVLGHWGMAGVYVASGDWQGCRVSGALRVAGGLEA